MVIGRHLFDMTNGWERRPPTGEHCSCPCSPGCTARNLQD
jgi:hypothetical protein